MLVRLCHRLKLLLVENLKCAMSHMEIFFSDCFTDYNKNVSTALARYFINLASLTYDMVIQYKRSCTWLVSIVFLKKLILLSTVLPLWVSLFVTLECLHHRAWTLHCTCRYFYAVSPSYGIPTLQNTLYGIDIRALFFLHVFFVRNLACYIYLFVQAHYLAIKLFVRTGNSLKDMLA